MIISRSELREPLCAVTWFAPTFRVVVLEGRQPEGTQLEELARAVRAMLGMKKFDIAELRATMRGNRRCTTLRNTGQVDEPGALRCVASVFRGSRWRLEPDVLSKES